MEFPFTTQDKNFYSVDFNKFLFDIFYYLQVCYSLRLEPQITPNGYGSGYYVEKICRPPYVHANERSEQAQCRAQCY